MRIIINYQSSITLEQMKPLLEGLITLLGIPLNPVSNKQLNEIVNI